jgi:TonB family protein
MASTNYTENKFDQYLQEIHTRERVKRRRRLVKVSLILAVLVVGFILVQQYTQQAEDEAWRTFTHADLTEEKVNTLFLEDTTGIVVSHHLLGWDTIRSIDDYKRFEELVDLIEITEEEILDPDFVDNESSARFVSEELEETSSKEEGHIQYTNDAKLKPYKLDINGGKVIGEKLDFAIINYDPSVKYTLDLGNGITKRMYRTESYAYPTKGSYTLRLIAQSKDRGSSIYSQKIYIQNPVSQQIASREKPGDILITEENSDQDMMGDLNRRTGFTVPRSQNEAGRRMTDDNSNIISGDIGIEDLGQIRREQQNNIAEPPAAKNVSQPYVYAEVMPSFPGGYKALNTFLKKKMRYPEEARRTKVQGQVIVQFVIEPDGTITSPKILKGIGGGCDQEALRIVNSMPKWIPGESNGLRVPVFQNIPINFKLFE